MLRFPDHVGKTLLMRLNEYEELQKKIHRLSNSIIGARRKQSELIGELKGILETEEYENAERRAEVHKGKRR